MTAPGGPPMSAPIMAKTAASAKNHKANQIMLISFPQGYAARGAFQSTQIVNISVAPQPTG